MLNGVVLFSSDRGITPAALAKAAEERGFDTIYVPEHTHIPVKREAAHPGTGDESLPDDRYTRTLDPWVSLATAAAVTSTIGLSTAVALPVESDPITLAKTLATLDHLSGGRVTIGAGRDGLPDIRVLIAFRPDSADLMAWAEAGVSELIWGVPDKPEDEVLTYLDKLASRVTTT